MSVQVQIEIQLAALSSNGIAYFCMFLPFAECLISGRRQQTLLNQINLFHFLIIVIIIARFRSFRFGWCHKWFLCEGNKRRKNGQLLFEAECWCGRSSPSSIGRTSWKSHLTSCLLCSNLIRHVLSSKLLDTTRPLYHMLSVCLARTGCLTWSSNENIGFLYSLNSVYSALSPCEYLSTEWKNELDDVRRGLDSVILTGICHFRSDNRHQDRTGTEPYYDELDSWTEPWLSHHSNGRHDQCRSICRTLEHCDSLWHPMEMYTAQSTSSQSLRPIQNSENDQLYSLVITTHYYVVIHSHDLLPTTPVYLMHWIRFDVSTAHSLWIDPRRSVSFRYPVNYFSLL